MNKEERIAELERRFKLAHWEIELRKLRQGLRIIKWEIEQLTSTGPDLTQLMIEKIQIEKRINEITPAVMMLKLMR